MIERLAFCEWANIKNSVIALLVVVEKLRQNLV